MPAHPSAPIPDANDADAAEQAISVDPPSSTVSGRITADPEAPEADGLEQAQEVPLPEEDR